MVSFLDRDQDESENSTALNTDERSREIETETSIEQISLNTLNADKFAFRPFVKLRTINEEANYAEYKHFGAFVKGPHKYPRAAVKHGLLANAYFRGNLGPVIV